MRLCSRAHATRAFLSRLSLALAIVVLTLASEAPLVAAWQTAPPSLPIPPHPPLTRLRASPAPRPNAPRFTSSRAPRPTPTPSRILGLLIDDGLDQLESFLPSLDDKIDVYVYVSDGSYAAATAAARWREPEATDVVNPGRVISRSTRLLTRRTPLEAENALRHAMSHVAAREASNGRIPADSMRGLAAYFERPVAARLARHAALVQNARAEAT